MIAEPVSGGRACGIHALLDTAAPEGLILTWPLCDNASVLA